MREWDIVGGALVEWLKVGHRTVVERSGVEVRDVVGRRTLSIEEGA